jgi:hypothetical protein
MSRCEPWRTMRHDEEYLGPARQRTQGDAQQHLIARVVSRVVTINELYLSSIYIYFIIYGRMIRKGTKL